MGAWPESWTLFIYSRTAFVYRAGHEYHRHVSSSSSMFTNLTAIALRLHSYLDNYCLFYSLEDDEPITTIWNR